MKNSVIINGKIIKIRDEYGNATLEYRQLMGENLYNMYEIKNRSDYEGSIVKYECTINKERGLFKERISTQSKDHIMEQVCYELATMIGVNCCRASCRKSQGIYGSFSRYEVTDINNIITFARIFNTIDLNADEFLYRCLGLTKSRINNFIIQVYKVIIFDFLTGQRDRHLENIGVYRRDNKISLYPLYDNGISCFSTESNDNAITFLNNGFYSSRMGTDEEILTVIMKYKRIFSILDLNTIINLRNLNYNTLYNIIKHSDKYNQMSERRIEATIEFILNQRNRLLRAGDKVCI